MEMDDQYGIADLRQLISRVSAPTPQFPPYPPQPPPVPPTELFSAQAQAQAHHHHHPTPAQYHEMLVMGRHVTTADMLTTARAAAGTNSSPFHHHQYHHHHNQQQDQFHSDSTTTTATAGGGFDGGDGGSARWPRQETLTLLEIRSRLDHKFKEANQKGPLWDEVARIMSEEHGYQRSGKKCREKFENLYKYYKKTKEGKAGRQDGKHYRFFRQLEALYGEHHHHNNNNPISTPENQITGNTPHFHNIPISPHQPNNHNNIIHQPPSGCDGTTRSASLSTSGEDEFATSSSDNDASMESNDTSSKEKRRKRRSGGGSRRSWKAKIKDFIDVQMKKIMEKQEAWLDKMMKTLEKREQDRVEREEEWRKQDAARIEREHKFWANERAWIEARDSALMKALENINKGNTGSSGLAQWAETEITRLIQLRTNMEARFQQCGFSEEVLWEDIAAKMAYFGHERTAVECKDKWDHINKSLQKQDKIIKEENHNKMYGGVNVIAGLYNNNNNNNNNDNGNGNCENNEPRLQLVNEGSSSSNMKGSMGLNDSCLRFFIGDAENLGWEANYGVKAQQQAG